MKKIEFKLDEIALPDTPCPYGRKHSAIEGVLYVGSPECIDSCPFFRKIDWNKQMVVCKADEYSRRRINSL